jgi:hypothetical protein
VSENHIQALQRIAEWPDAEMYTSLAPAQSMRAIARDALGGILTIDHQTADFLLLYTKDIRDHACARCVPHSDMIVSGFTCIHHRLLDFVERRAQPEAAR